MEDMSRSPHTAVIMATLLPLTIGVLAPTPSSARPARAATTVAGWSTAPTNLDAGSRLTVRLRVGGPPRKVLLQRRVGGAWRTVDSGRTSRADRVVLTWPTPRTNATHTVRVRVPRVRTHRATTTRPRQVRTRLPIARHSSLEQRVLVLVNQARSTARTCGSTSHPAAPPIAVDDRLVAAAGKWARRMASEGFFSHVGPDGSTPAQRIEAEGYRWRTWGENIAAGQQTAEHVVQSWLASPGHCTNIMNPAFTETGIGHVRDEASPSDDYWVQKFATPQ
jgi:uncharacterized protein YkwD